MRSSWLGALLAAAVLLPSAARADLGSDVERLTLGWSAFGQVTRLKPRLLERGDVLPLVLPAEPLDPKTQGCVTLAVLGPSTTHFLLDARALGDGALDWPEGSLAGALELTRCGAAKPELAALALEMRSPRAVIEFLMVTGDQRPPPLVQILPHRDPGPVAPLLGSGPRPSVAPLALRLRAVEERAAREQAIELSTQTLTASPLGTGSAVLTLAPGCHRFDLLANEGRRAADVDLDVASADGSELYASDHGESSDAGALVCVGAASPVAIRFGGVAPFTELALVRARWDLDASLPARWTPEVRARFSALLRAQRQRLGDAPLVDEALGVQGDTLMPFEIEPGGCYLALAAGLRGDAVSLSLAARTSLGDAQSRLDPDVPGAALSFCAGDDEHALIEVDARGLGLVWMAAVWRIGRTRLGEADR